MRELLPYLKKIEQKLGKEEQIKHILQETDFEKIHNVMVFLDWKWVNCGVPTVARLKQKAKYHLEAAWDMEEDGESQHYYCGSGGFVARKMVYDGLKMLSLTFELAGWEMNYEDVQNEDYS